MNGISSMNGIQERASEVIKKITKHALEVIERLQSVRLNTKRDKKDYKSRALEVVERSQSECLK